MIGIKEFNKMDLRVGTIEQAEKFPGAKQPAYKLYINFGEFGNKWSSAQITKNYSIEEIYELFDNENYNINKLDVNRVYRYLDSYTLIN